MSSPACCPRPQSSSSPVRPPLPFQDSPQWFHPRSPGTVGHHRSELLITSRSLNIPITHLLPAVAHRLSINTCVQLSLRLCGSIRNRRLDQHRTKSYEQFRSVPGDRGSTETDLHHHEHSNRYHFRHLHHFFIDKFPGYGKSHGQTGALLWSGGGMQRILTPMLAHLRDATTSISHWKSQNSLHHLLTSRESSSMGRDHLGSSRHCHPFPQRLH